VCVCVCVSNSMCMWVLFFGLCSTLALN